MCAGDVKKIKLTISDINIVLMYEMFFNMYVCTCVWMCSMHIYM